MVAATVPVTNRRCSICSDPVRSSFVDPLLTAGFSANRIENESRTANMPIKGETIAKHQRICRGGGTHLPPPVALPYTAEPIEIPADGPRDVAALVAAAGAQALIDGRLRVTTKDALQAQGLLDRRAEKEADREFMLGLTRLLSGGGKPAPAELMDGNTVEGQFTEVPNPALAPPELRG